MTRKIRETVRRRRSHLRLPQTDTCQIREGCPIVLDTQTSFLGGDLLCSTHAYRCLGHGISVFKVSIFVDSAPAHERSLPTGLGATEVLFSLLKQSSCLESLCRCEQP